MWFYSHQLHCYRRYFLLLTKKLNLQFWLIKHSTFFHKSLSFIPSSSRFYWQDQMPSKARSATRHRKNDRVQILISAEKLADIITVVVDKLLILYGPVAGWCWVCESPFWNWAEPKPLAWELLSCCNLGESLGLSLSPSAPCLPCSVHCSEGSLCHSKVLPACSCIQVARGAGIGFCSHPWFYRWPNACWILNKNEGCCSLFPASTAKKMLLWKTGTQKVCRFAVVLDT